MRASELSGLTASQVDERVSAGKTNAVNEKTSRSYASILRANVFTLFNLILASAATLVLIFGEPQDAVFGAVIIVNALIGIVTELRAKYTLDKLTILTTSPATVIRAGEKRELPTAEIVQDDILEFKLGDQIPVDAEIVSTAGIEVDESMLTGESIPVKKTAGEMLLSGSNVISGSACAVAKKVGAESYINSMQSCVKKFTRTNSDLQAGINRILKWISIILPVIILLLIYSQIRASGGTDNLFTDYGKSEIITNATAGIVGMIPEGLVLLTSLNFAIAAMLLARQNVLVQELPAVETLARVDTILLDKTGTITDGKIEMLHFSHVTEFNPNAYNPFYSAEHSLNALYISALNILTADADMNATNTAVHEWIVDPAKNILAKEFDDVELSQTASIPFSSERKYSAVSVKTADNHLFTFQLGAPEFVLDSKDNENAETFKAVKKIAGEGYRVIVLAGGSGEIIDEKLPRVHALAILTLSEHIRDDAEATLKYFREQGIDAKIISGDNYETVINIAEQVKLCGEERVNGMSAEELPDDYYDINQLLETVSVFGRVKPEQKRLIVQAMQAAGKTVAMTGDGVNDTLAMKDADLSIAMGNATEATKSTAKIILMDSKFSRLPAVLGQGRRVMANMERVSALFLTKTVYSILLAIFVSIFAFDFPLLPRQLTFIGALTIGIPAFILALPPNDKKYEKGFLNRVLLFAIPAGIICVAAMIAVNFFAYNTGLPLDEYKSMMTMCVLFMGLVVLSLKATPLKSWRLVLLIAMFAFAISGFITHPTRWFFRLKVPSFEDATAVIIICTISAVLLYNVVNLLLKRYNPAPKKVKYCPKC